MKHTLVLNASFEPLGVVAARRAIVLVMASKAISIEDTDGVFHSARHSIAMPAVIRLTRFVRVPHRGAVPLTRRALFARDGGLCAYCGRTATSVDHVVPRSRGGRHEWENVVAACSRCNRVKGDRTVGDLGWRLRLTPRCPAGAAWRVIASGRQDPSWTPYLIGHGVDDLVLATA